MKGGKKKKMGKEGKKQVREEDQTEDGRRGGALSKRRIPQK